MRVRIQYSVDLKDIPNKVSGFLNKAVDELDDVSRSLIEEQSTLNKGRASGDTIVILDDARRALARIDSILADSQAILSGYVEAKNTPDQPPPAAQEPENAIPEG